MKIGFKMDRKLDSEEIKEDLERSTGDSAHTMIEAGIATVPFCGGVAAIFDEVVQKPVTGRLKKWLIIISEDLEQVIEKVDNLTLEDLSKNDSFITTFTNATQIAIRNHQEEKLEALRNAALNSALPDAPEDDLQILFLNYIDSFTTLHITILKFFYEMPESDEWIHQLEINLKHNKYSVNENGKQVKKEIYSGKTYEAMDFNFWDVIKNEFKDATDNYGIYELVIRDLHSHILPNWQFIQLSYDKRFCTQLRGIGKQFMDYITSPVD